MNDINGLVPTRTVLTPVYSEFCSKCRKLRPRGPQTRMGVIDWRIVVNQLESGFREKLNSCFFQNIYIVQRIAFLGALMSCTVQ